MLYICWPDTCGTATADRRRRCVRARVRPVVSRVRQVARACRSGASASPRNIRHKRARRDTRRVRFLVVLFENCFFLYIIIGSLIIHDKLRRKKNSLPKVSDWLLANDFLRLLGIYTNPSHGVKLPGVSKVRYDFVLLLIDFPSSFWIFNSLEINVDLVVYVYVRKMSTYNSDPHPWRVNRKFVKRSVEKTMRTFLSTNYSELYVPILLYLEKYYISFLVSRYRIHSKYFISYSF